MLFQYLLFGISILFLPRYSYPTRPDEDHSGDDDEKVPTSSIIDILSSNASYYYLISALQKNDLIDYVNELTNVTFLAPINSAFENRGVQLGSKMSKNELDRFIIDQPIFREEVDGILIATTVNTFGSPFIEGFQVPLLLDHRVDNHGGNEVYYIENANVLSDDIYLSTTDSVVLQIDELLLDPKESICEYFQNTLNRNTGSERFKIFSSFLISDNTCKALSMSNLTFLVPSDNSLQLNHIEKKYLTHVRGLLDKNLLLSNFLIDGMIGGNLNNDSLITQNWNGEKISFSSSYLGDEIIINNQYHAAASNYLLSDGIIHYFENPIFDYKNHTSFPVYTPRKYLIGLDYEDFVDEIDFRYLSKLIDDPSINQTILVSNDYKIMGNLQNQLLYHFIDGNNKITSLGNGSMNEKENRLLSTKFCSTPDFCQKIKLEFDEDGTILLNSHTSILNKLPYTVGNTSLFILNEDISLPPKLQTAVASELIGYSKSIEFFKKFNYLKQLSKDDKFFTIFFPSSKLWNQLDLTLDYLVDNPNFLNMIIENLIINGLIYHDFEESKIFSTHSNHDLNISKIDETHLVIDNLTTVEVSFDSEIIFSNGVVHPIDDNFPLPKDLNISNVDLLSAQDSFEFEKILDFLNLTHVLDSNLGYSFLLPTSKSLLQENITHLLNDIKYLEKFAKLHILPPGSFDRVLDCYDENTVNNSTTLIPTMLNGTHLTCRQLASGGMMLSITEGSGNEVRILRHGITINGLSIGEFKSGIFLIDRPLNPAWISGLPGKLYLHLPLFAIFVGVLIGIVCVIFTFGCCIVLTLGKKTVTDGMTDEEGTIEHIASVNERLPLLNEEEDAGYSDQHGVVYKSTTNHEEMSCRNIGNGSNKRNHVNGGIENDINGVSLGRKLGKHNNSFDAKYSINASASPIDVNYE